MDIQIANWPVPYEAISPNSDKKYIFVSYSHHDSSIVYHDLHELCSNGARIWYDKAMNIGQDWQNRVKAKIMDPNCCGILFYLSPNSLKSTAVLHEIEFMNERKSVDSSFSCMSVNIGGNTAFSMMKDADIDEDAFFTLLSAFNHHKLFIARDVEPLSKNHLSELVQCLEDMDAIDPALSDLHNKTLFDYASYGKGFQVIGYNGLDSNVMIPAEIDGISILAIGMNAFKNNRRIKHISIPEGITAIDDFAFSGCHNLESILLPNSLVRVGYESFRECYSLRKITLPYHVAYIGDYCFYKCHALRSINILSSVPLQIQFAAFSECFAIENLILPDALFEIGPYAFNNCINLNHLVLPKQLRTIGLSAFYGCVSLSTIHFTQNYFVPNELFFVRCRKLQAIHVNASLFSEYIHSESWAELLPIFIFSLGIPQNIHYTDNTIIWESVTAADYYEIQIGDAHFFTTCPAYAYELPQNIPSVQVRIRACSNNPALHPSPFSASVFISSPAQDWDILIAGDHKILRKYLGAGCRVTIPDGITHIGEKAFYNNLEIEEIIFPQSVVEIGDMAFFHCVKLRKIALPKNIQKIGTNAFWGIRIEELLIPSSMTLLCDMAFACCNHLKEITIKSSSILMGTKVFYRCINLRNIEFPPGFIKMYNGILRGCTELDHITLPDGIETICSGSISYIMRLSQISIPASVTSIETGAFSNSFFLSDIHVDPQNRYYTDIDGVLIKLHSNTLMVYPPNKSASHYTTPDKVEIIGANAFTDTDRIQTITLSEDVRYIEAQAFERCPRLESVIINGNVEKIGYHAFHDCISLKRITINSFIVPEIESGSLPEPSLGVEIYVPKHLYKNYTRVIDWQDFIPYIRTY